PLPARTAGPRWSRRPAPGPARCARSPASRAPGREGRPRPGPGPRPRARRPEHGPPYPPSEGQARAELDVARVVAVLVDQAEVGTARVLVGVPEHGVVEPVDGLHADLQLDVARQRERLVQAEVH